MDDTAGRDLRDREPRARAARMGTEQADPRSNTDPDTVAHSDSGARAHADGNGYRYPERAHADSYARDRRGSRGVLSRLSNQHHSQRELPERQHRGGGSRAYVAVG